MNQYFVKYSLNGQSKLNQFVCAVDVEQKSSARISTNEILIAVVLIHNIAQGVIILKDDIVIEVLTRLN